MKMPKKVIILSLIIFSVFISCTKVKYTKSIYINAPYEKVFSILEDYENYPNFIEEFHKTVTIISDIKKGKGVIFENTSSWNNYKIKSEYEVIGYEKNFIIEMKNKTQYGFTKLIIEKTDKNKSKYTLINELEIPKSMENKLLQAFDKELQLVKEYSEKIWRENENSRL